MIVCADSLFSNTSTESTRYKNLRDSIHVVENKLTSLKDSLITLMKRDSLALAMKNKDRSEADEDTIRYWKYGGNGSLIFNQIELGNWAQGGESSYSGVVILKTYANYSKGAADWENTYDLAYGLIKLDGNPIRKSEDKIDVSSKFGYKAVDKLYYTGLLNFKTQFVDGFNYPNDSVVVSKFFAPAYLYASLGMDFKPDNEFSIYLSPASGRLIFVMEQELADKGAYSVEKAIYDSSGTLIQHGKRGRADFGASLRTRWKTSIVDGIHIDTKLDLFNNYTDMRKSNRKNIDVNLETSLILSITDYIKTNLFIHLIYDDDIKSPIYEWEDGVKNKIGEGPRLQVKETLGIGLSYKF